MLAGVVGCNDNEHCLENCVAPDGTAPPAALHVPMKRYEFSDVYRLNQAKHLHTTQRWWLMRTMP